MNIQLINKRLKYHFNIIRFYKKNFKLKSKRQIIFNRIICQIGYKIINKQNIIYNKAVFNMNLDWNLLLTALGLALVFEGVSYTLMAEKMRALLISLSQATPNALRTGGLICMALGVFFVWLAKP